MEPLRSSSRLARAALPQFQHPAICPTGFWPNRLAAAAGSVGPPSQILQPLKCSAAPMSPSVSGVMAEPAIWAEWCRSALSTSPRRVTMRTLSLPSLSAEGAAAAISPMAAAESRSAWVVVAAVETTAGQSEFQTFRPRPLVLAPWVSSRSQSAAVAEIQDWRAWASWSQPKSLPWVATSGSTFPAQAAMAGQSTLAVFRRLIPAE